MTYTMLFNLVYISLIWELQTASGKLVELFPEVHGVWKELGCVQDPFNEQVFDRPTVRRILNHLELLTWIVDGTFISLLETIKDFKVKTQENILRMVWKNP